MPTVGGVGAEEVMGDLQLVLWVGDLEVAAVKVAAAMT